MNRRLCRECDGDKVVVARVRFDEVRGALMYDTAPCGWCDGTGWVEVEPVRRPIGGTATAFGCGLCLGVLMLVAAILGGHLLDVLLS